MICAWKELLGILPLWLRPEVDKLGKESLEVLRLRLKAPPQLLLSGKIHTRTRTIPPEDLHFVINHASSFSPWASESLSRGYLTAPGGHRVGICGETVCKDTQVTGIREVTSLCIRVARAFPGIGEAIGRVNGSVLILGAPGWGKTTMLRDMVSILSRKESVAVVDERGEVFPMGLDASRDVDVLLGAPKPQGVEMVLRTMGPSWIAVDEITSGEDCEAILNCHGCGVKLLATAHGAGLADYYHRPVYRPLVNAGVFSHCYVLRPDKTGSMERVNP